MEAMSQPALFVSHGAPSIVLDRSPAHEFLKSWRHGRAAPSAILVATAHFEAPGPTLTAAAHPDTIHDFRGFAPELHAMRYAAPGAPALAARAQGLLAARGFAPQLDPARGFDHGTWTPLMLMYPDATIPVVQLSVDPARDAAWHVGVGAALTPLRDDNVLIVGSGSFTHDLGAFFRGPPRAEDAAPAPYVAAFADWARAAIADGRTDDLVHWIDRGPHALRNHPTPEHFLPLFVALGAGSGARGERVHGSFSHGVLAMDAFVFG